MLQVPPVMLSLQKRSISSCKRNSEELAMTDSNKAHPKEGMSF